MALDVVVVNYKTPDLLANFVYSYAQHAWEGCNLTAVHVEENEVPKMFRQIVDHRIIVTPENVGYARACNEGARYGTNP